MEDYVSVDSDDDYDYLYYDDGTEDGGDSDRLEFAETKADADSQSVNVKVITRESLLAAQREDLRKVMDVLSLKEHHARSLLIHYRWDVNQLLSGLVEKGKDKLYAEVGVTILEHRDLVSSNFSSSKAKKSTVLCEICFEKVPTNVATTMDCGHVFCNTCWTKHFIVKIKGGQSRRIRCMAHKCNSICDEEKIRMLVSTRDPILAEKFDRFLLESYIEDNKKVKWCPSTPHCGNALRIDDCNLCEVECACGLKFCFKCSSEAHSPCSCQMWELWSQKCRDESETVNWITVNTKPCPKCLKPVEKNGGCNHVHCICGQHFCWHCGRPDKFHGGYHSCGRYTEDEQKTRNAKRDLQRYMHYYDRYKAHKHSSELESKLQKTMKKKMSELEAREITSKDYSWATEGLNRLFRSRQILSYSYPFAYYMFGDIFGSEMTKQEKVIKQHLFEDQQQQLEAHVERLSSFLEAPFNEYPDNEVITLRMEIINFSTVVDKLCRKLYECIENDLLGCLTRTSQSIAPYMSNGMDKASEVTDCKGL